MHTLLFFLICSSSSIFAGEISEISEYIAGHPAVQAAQAQIKAAESEQNMQFTMLFPFKAEALVETSFSGEGFGIDGQITLNYTLFDPDQLRKYNKTDNLIKSATESLEWIKQELLYRILSEYLKVKSMEEHFDLIKNHRDSLSQSTEGSRKRFDLGDLNQTELNYALSRLAVAEAEYIKAGAAVESASMEFKHSIQGNIPRISIPEPEKLDNSVSKDSLREKRHDIKQMEILINAAEEEITGSKSMLPGIKLSTGGYGLLSGSPEFRFGVGIDIPLSAISYNTNRTEAFILEKERLLYNLEDYTAQEFLKLEQIVLSLNSLKRIETQYSEALDYSKKAMQGIQIEYGAGNKSMFDLLTAQNNYYSMGRELSAVKSAFKKAILDYYYISGELNLEFINSFQ